MTLTYHQKKAEEKTEKILKGALSQFLQDGYLGASMDRIAQAAGVSKQTLYSYFGDKESLFKALIRKVTTDKFKLVWSASLQGEPEIVLKALAKRIVQEVNEPQYLAFVHIVVTEAKKYPEIGELFLNNVAKPAIIRLTEYLQTCPQLNLDDPQAIAHIFINTIIHHILTQETLQGKVVIPIESERLIDSLVQMIINSSKF